MTAESTGDNSVVVVAGAVAAGAPVALLTAWLIGAFDVEALISDEPPIRVRNGSIELRLLHGTLGFEEDGSTGKKEWRIQSEPERNKNDVTVLLLPSSPKSCNGYVESANKIEFFYSTGKKIVVQSNGNKRIRVKGDDPLDNPSNNRQLLRYDVGDAYIQSIDIGNKKDFCKFDAPDANLQVFILD